MRRNTRVLVRSLLILLPVWAMSCSKIPLSKISSGATKLESDGTSKGDDKKPASEDAKQETETASPPSNVTGSYLVCDTSQLVDQAQAQSTTQCVLKDRTTDAKVDLAVTFVSFEWMPSVPEVTSVSSTFRELPQTSPWHVELLLKAPTQLALDQALQGANVSIRTKDRAGVTQQSSISVVNKGTFWLELNGESVPSSAVAGGTEHEGRDLLSVCRVYYQGGIYPGKLIPHYSQPRKSVCYSTKDGLDLISQSDDARTMLMESDVLVMGTLGSDEVEWKSATSGLVPGNAIVGGVDDLGTPLYICRNRQSAPPPSSSGDTPNSPAGEWTPGYLKGLSGVCVHEYYGAKSSSIFEVLVPRAISNTRAAGQGNPRQ